MLCGRRSTSKIVPCGLDCVFSFEGFCQAHSQRAWEEEFEVSLGLWGTQQEPEAPIPRDCPIYQLQETPLWRR